MGENIKRVSPPWLGWLMNQSHPGFLGGSACLATITGNTGTDHIFPGMLSAPVSRDDMVQGKVSALLATILAGVLVTLENFKSG
jgi:hypothetical protein